MKKITFLFTLLILTQSCGFSPIYVSKDNINFNIEIITYKGDQELNNYIDIGLKKYVSKNSNNKTFKISTISSYTKQAQSRDAKGNTQSFKVGTSVTFMVTEDDQTLNFSYTEQADLNNSNDTFELNSYENTIKQNFASSIVEKLVLDLLNRK